MLFRLDFLTDLKFCQPHKEGGEQEEVEEVETVDDASTHGLIVVVDAEALDDAAEVATVNQGAYEGEAVEQDEAEGGSENKCHNLVAADGRGKGADSAIDAGKEDESDERSPEGAVVDVAEWLSHEVEGDIPYNGWQECHYDECPTRERLADDKRPLGGRTGEEHLQSALTTLFGKETHRHCRTEEEVEPWCQRKESVQLRIATVQHVESSRQHPEKETSAQEKQRQDDIANGRGEETSEFLFEKGKNRMHSIKFLLFVVLRQYFAKELGGETFL